MSDVIRHLTEGVFLYKHTCLRVVPEADPYIRGALAYKSAPSKAPLAKELSALVD